VCLKATDCRYSVRNYLRTSYNITLGNLRLLFARNHNIKPIKINGLLIHKTTSKTQTITVKNGIAKPNI